MLTELIDLVFYAFFLRIHAIKIEAEFVNQNYWNNSVHSDNAGT